MNILKFPDVALLTPCVEVTQFGPELRTILMGMLSTMRAANGIGIAANQVGLNIRAIVVLDDFNTPYLMVNPYVIQNSSHLASLEEGCLSAPGERIDTKSRYAWVNVRYQDMDGIIKTKMFGGVSSVCVQHEIEHLQGKAFFQNSTITKTKRIRLCKKWGVKFK